MFFHFVVGIICYIYELKAYKRFCSRIVIAIIISLFDATNLVAFLYKVLFIQTILYTLGWAEDNQDTLARKSVPAL